MLRVEEYEQIRRAHDIDGLSIRQIARDKHHGRSVIRKALANAAPAPYQLRQPRPCPVLDPFKGRIEDLWAQNEHLPRKQRYTAVRIYQLLREEGYQGSEVSVRRYVSLLKKDREPPEAYLPLSFDPGMDAQVDWGEAVVVMAGAEMVVQYLTLRLAYSKARFVMAFPCQKQEAFFLGHECAFDFFGGVPRRLIYDNLKTAVFKVLAGRSRQEQEAFIALRSHYLFQSRYCNLAQAHEKGGVESDIGYVRRRFFTPPPVVADFQELNEHLYRCCRQDLERKVRGQELTVAELLAGEQAHLLCLPQGHYPPCRYLPVRANRYSQVTFETNRYSVPVAQVKADLLLRAYPFRVEVVAGGEVVASHQRCFARQQDIIEPLHYLPLLVARPGAFEHALPLRRWRERWPAVYEQVLSRLLEGDSEGRGLRQFLAILALHQKYPATLVAAALERALALGAVSADGVKLCLAELSQPQPPAALILPEASPLAAIGAYQVDPAQYDRLWAGG